MPSPGSVSPVGLMRGSEDRPGARLLAWARSHERVAGVQEAIESYEYAIGVAEQSGESEVLAEALRRLAIQRLHQDEVALARNLCRRSYEVALQIGDQRLTAEALNTLGGMELTTGSLAAARQAFLQALEFGAGNREVRARVEQNLGILANVQGDLAEALSRYRRSLEAYHAAHDEHGCAIAYHNLGMVSADATDYEKADRYFRESRAIAERLGDLHLLALSLVNGAEVAVARQRYEEARQDAEEALSLFDRLGVRGARSDAYRVVGMVYRETGRPLLAERELRTAIDLAVASGSLLSQAEACRELALVFQSQARNQDTLRYLNEALRLFRRLNARLDQVDVTGKVAELEATYRAVVRDWGRSIESVNDATFGHCERVARLAVALALTLGLDDQEQTAILLGAYLHDVGMLWVPPEILTKPDQLTPRELRVVQMHPVWGVEMLDGIDFPWDLRPIIRWHHERRDGSGYPDGLQGDAIPIAAEIVGVAEAFDSLTWPRSGQPAESPEVAVQQLLADPNLWSPRVLQALQSVLVTSAGTSH